MTDRTQRIALWTLALLLVAGMSLALRYARGYRPLAGLPGDATPFPADIGIRFDGIQVVGRHEGRRAWTLKAGQVETTRSGGQIVFSGGIQATLLGKDGKPAASLTAPVATFNQPGRALDLTGDIACRIRDLGIFTNALQWDAGSNLVRCPRTVRAVNPRGEVRGENLEVDTRTREYSLRNVRARFRVDPSGELPL